MYCVKTNVARNQFFSVLFGFFLLLSNKFTIWLGFQLKKPPTNLNPINCNTKIPLDFSSILKQNKLQRYFTYLLTITQSDGTDDLWEFLTSIKNWNNRNIMLHMMGSPEEQRIRIIIYQTASIRGKPYWAWRGWADQKRIFFSPPKSWGYDIHNPSAPTQLCFRFECARVRKGGRGKSSSSVKMLSAVKFTWRVYCSILYDSCQLSL